MKKPTFSFKFASWFTGTCLNNIEHPVYGKHKVTEYQIVRLSGTNYRTKLFKEMELRYYMGDITDELIKWIENGKN